MKEHKWDIIMGGLFNCLPFWILLIPIVIDNFTTDAPLNDTSALALALMSAFWCLGMNLERDRYLENEVENLKKKLNELE